MTRSKHQVFLVIIAPAIIYPTAAFADISEEFKNPAQIDAARVPLAGQGNVLIQNSTGLNSTVLMYGTAQAAARHSAVAMPRVGKTTTLFDAAK